MVELAATAFGCIVFVFAGDDCWPTSLELMNGFGGDEAIAAVAKAVDCARAATAAASYFGISLHFG